MTYQATVIYCLEGYSELFKNRLSVDNHLFAVVGNGYDWYNGQLCEPDIEYDIEHDDYIKTYDCDDTIFDKVPKKFADSYNNYNGKITYPISSYSEIYNIPNDVQPDWLEAIDNFVNYCLEHTEYLCVTDYDTVDKQLDILNKIKNKIENLRKMKTENDICSEMEFLPYEKCLKMTRDGFIPEGKRNPIFPGSDYVYHLGEYLIEDGDCWAVTQEQWDEFYSNNNKKQEKCDKTIFENVEFGDKFLTKSNKLVIYLKKTIKNRHYLISKDYLEPIPYDDEGHCFGDYEWNIITRYQEPIDEDKLDNEAKLYAASTYSSECPLKYQNPKDIIEQSENIFNIFVDGFKTGYLKAKEGQK